MSLRSRQNPVQPSSSTTAPCRVCFVLSYFFPLQSGAERQALEQAIELVRQGHEVHVLTRWVPGLKVDDQVRGVHIHRWVKLARWGPLFGLSFLHGFNRGLARLRPHYDVIHTHQALWEAASTGLFRMRNPSVPTVIQPASSGFYGEAQELDRTRGKHKLRRWILQNSRFATISQEIGQEWRGLGVPEEKLFATASGVDTNRFRPGPCAFDDALPPHPRVLFTGRLHPQKNLPVLLDAWPLVLQQLPAHLLLIGEGPDRPAIEAQIQAKGLAGHVHLLGAVADPAEYLRGADFFVLPSLAEGMSNSLLEAMATAVPCLASDIGGNQDLIVNEQTGLLLPTNDSQAWAAAIVNLLSRPERATQLGHAGFQFVQREHAISRIVDRNLKLYAELLGRGIGSSVHESGSEFLVKT